MELFKWVSTEVEGIPIVGAMLNVEPYNGVVVGFPANVKVVDGTVEYDYVILDNPTDLKLEDDTTFDKYLDRIIDTRLEELGIYCERETS